VIVVVVVAAWAGLSGGPAWQLFSLPTYKQCPYETNVAQVFEEQWFEGASNY
jgi:hypothetical protein